MYTCEFIEFEGKGYGEEEELVANGNQQRDREIVVVQRMDSCHTNQSKGDGDSGRCLWVDRTRFSTSASSDLHI